MILVKKILGLVLTLFVVFSFVGVGRANAQWQCSVNNGFCNIGGFCRSCDRNAACEANGDGKDYACCMGVGEATGDPNNPCQCRLDAACGGNPQPTVVPPTPTPLVNGYVKGGYRLQPGNVAIGETHFGSDQNKISVYLDEQVQDMLIPHNITSGGIGDGTTNYTSLGIVTWKLLDAVPGAWAVRSSVPSGYAVGYTICYNNTQRGCHVVPTGQPVPNMGNRVVLDEQTMLATRVNGVGDGSVEVFWHYCKNQAPGGLRVSPELACGQTGAQTVMWDGLAGTVTYQLRIDNGGNWTGDVNGDGQCDFQGLGGDGDYCVDNIPATVSPSYVIASPGLPSGKTYRIWVHAINQCGGGTTVSTQINYARTCPSPTVPVPSATGTAVSCQNITVWKNGVRLVEPYAAIALNDRIDFKAAVASSRSVSKIYYQVTKGTNRPQRIGVSAFCPAGGTTRNQYTATLNLLQDVSGSYNVKYDGVDYGTCMPLVTLVP